MRCLAVCQDELVIRMLDEILLPGFEVEFIVDGRALARRERVLAARARQHARFRRVAGRVWSNARMTPRMLRTHCAVDDASKRRLEEAVGRMGLSARAYDRILKVARTVADLAGRDRIGSGDIAEAVRYRSLDRSYWSG